MSYYAPSVPAFRRTKSIKSDEHFDLSGPLEVMGSVKCESSINFLGDIVVRERIDAYGSVNMSGGTVRCHGKMKIWGNVQVHGNLVAGDKLECTGKLTVMGTMQGVDLKVYGNLTINGYLACRRLVVHGNVTLIGPNSTYSAPESEQISGSVSRRREEADWDWQ